MSRSAAEHLAAKLFHQQFGITLYPYPGEETDLQSPCGLNIEVKAIQRGGCYGFQAKQIFKKQFDVAVLLRIVKRKRKRYIECALWALNDIRELVVLSPNRHAKRRLSLRPPERLQWYEMPYH